MFETEIARGDRRTQQRTKPLKRRGAKVTVTGNRNRHWRDGADRAAQRRACVVKKALREPGVCLSVVRIKGESDMRKAIAELDEEQRAALLQVADLGIAVCASALMSTRELAPRVAQAARNLLGPGSVIHLSGCPKGCAHSTAAAFTLTGPRYLIVGGRANDPPAREISPTEFIAELEKLSDG